MIPTNNIQPNPPDRGKNFNIDKDQNSDSEIMQIKNDGRIKVPENKVGENMI